MTRILSERKNPPKLVVKFKWRSHQEPNRELTQTELIGQILACCNTQAPVRFVVIRHEESRSRGVEESSGIQLHEHTEPSHHHRVDREESDAASSGLDLQELTPCRSGSPSRKLR
jgi:hypothetical protein